MRADVKQTLLRALLRMDGKPLSEESLAMVVSKAHNVGLILMRSILGELESDGLVGRLHDETLDMTTYSLTASGRHKAVQL